MKFTILKSPLLTAISHVSNAVSSKTTIPILTGIKIVVNETGCSLMASDSDISIQVNLPLEVNGEEQIKIAASGSVVLPARYFFDIVRKLPGDTVQIEVAQQYVTTILSEQSRFQLNGMDPDEFPRLPQLQQDEIISLPANLFKTMIRQTSFAVSTAETRPVLTGVEWLIQDNVLRFIATDSHRLAKREAQIEMAAQPSVNKVIVPGKSLADLNKILSDDDDLVDIVLTENQLLVKTANVLFYSRLLDGNYPDTTRIIPQSSKANIVLETKQLLHAIDRASLLTRDGKNNVVKLEGADETLHITANSPEVGKVTENVPLNEFSGEPFKISFNAKYMIDALRALDSEHIRIQFTGPMAPFIIQPTDYDAILYLILPVRTY